MTPTAALPSSALCSTTCTFTGRTKQWSLFFSFQEEEAKQLVRDAIAAGIYNDLGSGSNIDLCVISKSKLDFLRPYDVANKKGERLVLLRPCLVPALLDLHTIHMMLSGILLLHS